MPEHATPFDVAGIVGRSVAEVTSRQIIASLDSRTSYLGPHERAATARLIADDLLTYADEMSATTRFTFGPGERAHAEAVANGTTPCGNCGHPYREHALSGTCMEPCDCPKFVAPTPIREGT